MKTEKKKRGKFKSGRNFFSLSRKVGRHFYIRFSYSSEVGRWSSERVGRGGKRKKSRKQRKILYALNALFFYTSQKVFVGVFVFYDSFKNWNVTMAANGWESGEWSEGGGTHINGKIFLRGGARWEGKVRMKRKKRKC